jgi:hypothetical protein
MQLKFCSLKVDVKDAGTFAKQLIRFLDGTVVLNIKLGELLRGGNLIPVLTVCEDKL